MAADVSAWGFGSPSSTGPDANGYFDWGYGSPTPVGWDPDQTVDFGYGDPVTGYLAPINLLPVQAEYRYPDDGGVIITVKSEWAAMGSTFRVKVKSQATGTTYPLSGVGLRSAVPSEGTTIKPLLDGKRLRFVLPPLPKATYDIYIYYGPGYGQVKIVVGAFKVVFRHHSIEQWVMRNTLPSHWSAAGARAGLMEPALVSPSTEWPHPILQALTRALAEEVQTLAGRAVTRLTADFAEAGAVATVETTLGFPSSGQFCCGGKLFNYTGRTDSTFTGCTVAKVYDGVGISAGIEVFAVPTSWKPEE